MSSDMKRRGFLGALAGAASTSILGGQSVGGGRASAGMDLVLSVSKRQGDVITDLGGLFRENILTVDELLTGDCCGIGSQTKVLSWRTAAMPAELMTADSARTAIDDTALPITVVAPVSDDGTGNSIRLSKLQLFEADQDTPFKELMFGEPLQISFNAQPQVIYQEISAEDGVVYQIFGVASRRPSIDLINGITFGHPEATHSVSATAQPKIAPACASYWFENLVDLGYYAIPGKPAQWRLHGPELHPLTPCRSQCTWHMNFLLKRPGASEPFANNHYGAYYENGQFCLIYWDNVRNYCSISCNRRLPSWSQVYNWLYQVIDTTFREVAIVLPYFVLASIVLTLTGVFFGSLAGIAFA